MRLLALPLFFALAAFVSFQEPVTRVIEPGHRHLGNDETPEWSEAPAAPEGKRLDLEFKAKARSGDSVLWINDKDMGTLKTNNEPADFWYHIEGGTLKSGKNTLSVTPEGDPNDDIVLGNFRLVEGSLRDALGLQPVTVTVIDGGTSKPIPSRVNFFREDNKATHLFFTEPSTTPIREDLAYTVEGVLKTELQPGEYTVYASHGTEWSVAETSMTVSNTPVELSLTIHHEIDTTGFISCDTHIHTLEFSGHGDSSALERVVTIAGEGVELPIATDHNHNLDYRPYQKQLKLNKLFTPVTGNEVTTDNGHFNAFPLDPDDEIPVYKERDWVKLVDGIRAKGAKTVILNHPRWPGGNSPYENAKYDPMTGLRGDNSKFHFNGMEVVNSDTAERDPLLLYRDWFGLVNQGEGVMAIGASDSHAVGVTVGGGRTYVKSKTDRPDKIDVDEACENINAGRASVSHGIFCDVWLAKERGESVMGEEVKATKDGLDIIVRAASASWAQPKTIILYVNGYEVERAEIAPSEGPKDIHQLFHVDLPHNHDVWISSIVLGAHLEAPWWGVQNKYTLGSTNPVWVDRDGKRGYESPRATAARLIQRARGDASKLPLIFEGVDDTVLIQALTMLDDEQFDALADLGDARAEASDHFE
ncbi:MAG: CehA/McbA family metallohydrolase, partial [Planctomycetes bacterium]|nr:CehA/McbA family metallohydrolase [Planctomycetota bacterium]